MWNFHFKNYKKEKKQSTAKQIIIIGVCLFILVLIVFKLYFKKEEAKNLENKIQKQKVFYENRIKIDNNIESITVNKNPGNETILIDESEFEKIVDCINSLEISEINEKDFVGETTTIQIDTDKQSYNITITEPYLVYNGKGYKIEDGTYDELKNIINELLGK